MSDDARTAALKRCVETLDALLQGEDFSWQRKYSAVNARDFARAALAEPVQVNDAEPFPITIELPTGGHQVFRRNEAIRIRDALAAALAEPVPVTEAPSLNRLRALMALADHPDQGPCDAIRFDQASGGFVRSMLTEPAQPDYRRLLENLLAVIHGDGGHHTIRVGFEQSATDAEARVIREANAVLPIDPDADRLLSEHMASVSPQEPRKVRTFDDGVREERARVVASGRRLMKSFHETPGYRSVELARRPPYEILAAAIEVFLEDIEAGEHAR